MDTDGSRAQRIEASREPLTADAVLAASRGASPLERVVVEPALPSTNTTLAAALTAEPDGWPHLSALATDHQTAGRGRAGRTWETPRGAALTVSFATWPELTARGPGWPALVAGLAVVRACEDVGVRARTKWPNDVVALSDGGALPGWGRWRKCAGILSETHPSGATIIGVGLNVSQTDDEIPVAHGASLATLGATDLDRAALLVLLAARLKEALAQFAAEPEAIARECEAASATLDNEVTVTLGDGSAVSGVAVRLGEGGELIVREDDGAETAVFAGDVSLRLA